MKNFSEDLVNKLIDLYRMYEVYIWRHDDTKIDILIQDNSISFYVYNSEDDLDELIVDFSNKEKNLYKYVCLRILLMLIKDCVIFQDDNIFYSNVHKPYLRLIVNDDKIKGLMGELVARQLVELITERTDIIMNVRNSVNLILFYPSKFMNKLDERIGLSRKLLKNGGGV